MIGYNSNSDLHRSNKDLEYTANKTPICGYDLPVIFDRSRHTFKFSIRKIKLSAEKEAITINRIYNTNIICLDLYPFIHKSYS